MSDRDPRRDPIEGDVMQIGRTFFYVARERWAHHVGYKRRSASVTTYHTPLWDWRRVMADPEAIVVRRGDA